MNAIRIKGDEVIKGADWHIDLLLQYQKREALSDCQIDAMIEAKDIEFGGVWWDSRSNQFVFMNNETKGDLYSSLDAMAYYYP